MRLANFLSLVDLKNNFFPFLIICPSKLFLILDNVQEYTEFINTFENEGKIRLETDLLTTSTAHFTRGCWQVIKNDPLIQMDTLVLLWGLDLWSPSFSWLRTAPLVKLGSYGFKLSASNVDTLRMIHLSQHLVTSRLFLWFTLHVPGINQSKTELFGLNTPTQIRLFLGERMDWEKFGSMNIRSNIRMPFSLFLTLCYWYFCHLEASLLIRPNVSKWIVIDYENEKKNRKEVICFQLTLKFLQGGEEIRLKMYRYAIIKLNKVFPFTRRQKEI